MACIYNEAAVAKEMNLPAGADIDAFVRERLEKGNYGSLLGYGMDTITERPCFRVGISRNGVEIFGFMTSPDKQKATQYAQQRLEDFKREFPESHPPRGGEFPEASDVRSSFL